jgi:hypothetical protein
MIKQELGVHRMGQSLGYDRAFGHWFQCVGGENSADFQIKHGEHELDRHD